MPSDKPVRGLSHTQEEKPREPDIGQLMASMTPATDTPPDVVAPIVIPYEQTEGTR